MKATILVLAMFLAGCSTFRLGAFCYLPADNASQCSVATMPAPQTTTEEKAL